MSGTIERTGNRHPNGTATHLPSERAFPMDTFEPITLDADEARLLRTYAEGARIWDATSIFQVVMRLEEKALIEPTGPRGAYALTAAGIAVIERAS